MAWHKDADLLDFVRWDPNHGKSGVPECPWGWEHCTSQEHSGVVL